MVNTSALALGVTLLASIAAFLYNPIALRLQIFGVLRSWHGFENLHGEGMTAIPDLFGVEDLHYHEPSGIVFGVTEDSAERRASWFPPNCNFKNATDLGCGRFFMLLPEEDHATRLEFSNYEGPFVTHGFDIATDPTNDESIYFIAVNHLPNPLFSLASHEDIPAARSQIELFQYIIGSTTVQHLRSILTPLIRTPNDIFAVSSTSFYVTNDHSAREGLYRVAEDIGHDDFAAWSDIIHIEIEPAALESASPSTGFVASVAMDGLQNPNGLGHGRVSGEIMMVRAASGILSILGPRDGDGKLEVKDRVQLPSCLDNPVYFHDPYAQETGRDASGFVLAGLAYRITFPDAPKNPSVVWLVQPPGGGEREEVEVAGKKPLGEWRQTCIFMDDGGVVNTASTAVLVAISPTENGGRKQAWLLVTGPLGVGVYRTKVDL